MRHIHSFFCCCYRYRSISTNCSLCVKFVRFNVILLLLLFSGKVEVRCGGKIFFTYLSRIFTSYWSVIFTSYISNPVISYVLHFQSTRLARAVKFAVFWAHGDNYYQVWGWYAYPFLFHCINVIDTFDLPEHTHTHTHPFNSPLSGSTRVSRYQKGKTNLGFTGARQWVAVKSEWLQFSSSVKTDFICIKRW